MGKLLGRRDDDGFNLGSQAAVCVGDGPFVFKIEHVAHAPHYVAYAKVAADVDGKSVVLNDFDILKPGSGLAYDALFLIVGIKAPLVLVDADGNDHVVEHCKGAPQDVEVTCGKGVERPGEQCCSVHSETKIQLFLLTL